MVDAYEVLSKTKYWRHGVKKGVKQALSAYDRWDVHVKHQAGETYGLWLDTTVRRDETAHTEALLLGRRRTVEAERRRSSAEGSHAHGYDGDRDLLLHARPGNGTVP